MAWRKINDTKLTAIADAIREKTGGTEALTLDAMPTEIAAIESGGGGFPNGTEWTQSNVTDMEFKSVHNENGIWVAAGYYNSLYYSIDGKIWTKTGLKGLRFRPCYANGIWVTSSTTGMYYSTDGMTWTKSNVTSGNNLGDPLCAKGVWTVNGYYSTDGMTWTQANVTVTDRLYADGVWVASATDGAYYSTDGMTWTKSNVTTITWSIRNANGIFLIWADSDYTAYYSTDGKTWTQCNGLTNNSLYSAIYANGFWLVCNDNGLYRSTDGKTWAYIEMDDVFGALVYANGLFIGSGMNAAYYSTDGMTWTELGQFWFNEMYYANGIWLTADANEIGILYSTDGKTWIPVSYNGDDIWGFYDVCCAGGVWVLAPQGGGLYYSVAWEQT